MQEAVLFNFFPLSVTVSVPRLSSKLSFKCLRVHFFFFQVYFRFTGCLACPPAVGALILAQPSLSSSVREGSVLLVFSIFAVSK